MLAALIQIDGYDPVAGAAVTLRGASHDDQRLCMLNGQTWWPTIEKLPTLRYDLFDGSFGGQITAPTGSMSLATEAWTNFGRYLLSDARFRLWTAELGDPWSSFTLRFDGRVTTQPRAADGMAQLSVAVDDRWLDTALLPVYAGTTGAEGPAAMKGQVKPLAIGAPRYVPGTLVDPVNSVFQVSLGATHGFEAALERLARFGAPVANYASYATLVAATIAPGAWATANAVGMARFGAPPTGQISFLLQGDEAGTEGWVRTPGKVIRRLALLSGGAGKISDASLNALDTARPYNISLNIDEQTTAREFIQRIAASLNCVAGVSWLGQLFVVPIAIGTPTWTLAADGSSLPPVSSVEQVEIDAPFKSLSLQGERTWMVHPYSEIAFTAEIVDRGAYDAGTTYREGNIVSASGGSRFIYTATVPAAGITPPNLSYWTAYGNDGLSPPLLKLNASAQVLHLNADGTLPSGTPNFVFTAARQNYTGTIALGADPSHNLTLGGGSIVGDVLTVTAARMREVLLYNRDTLGIGLTQKVIATGDGGLTDYVKVVAALDGADGVTPKIATLTPPSINVVANSANASKSGQFPKTAALSVKQGLTDITGAASITLTPSDPSIVASYSAGVVSVTQADTAGYIDIQVSHASAVVDVLRLAVTRTRDPSPGASQTNDGEEINATLSSTSFAQIAAPPVVLRANASGQIVVSWGGDYTCAAAGATRTFVMGGCTAWRTAGSGTYAYTTEQTGTTATTSPGGTEVIPGSITVSETLTGLTPGAQYELAPAARRNSGNGTATITGSFQVSQ